MEDLKENETISENDQGETPDPGTEEPVTPDPGKEDPVTPDPGKEDPVTPDPGKEDPVTPDPGKEEPVTPDPGKEDPAQPDPGTEEPAMPDLGTEEPSTEQTMQRILDDFRERLNQKDTDVQSLTESMRSLVDVMSVEGETEITIPFEKREHWDYPIKMQFQVYPYGAGYWMQQSEEYDDCVEFETRYKEIVSLCGEGGTLKDFYVEYIWDNYGENLVYDYTAQTEEPPAETPAEDLHPAILETLQAVDTRLETVETTLAEINSISGNTLEYYQEQADYREKMLNLQIADTGSTIMLCIAVFAVLGEMLMKHLLEGIK